jgi:hypothetical protein
MEGSLTQLGLSNYLITQSGPSVSFFRHAYKNHANYVKDTRELHFKDDFNFGKTASFRFDEDGKYGDAVSNIIISVKLPDISNYLNINGHKYGYCNGVGNAIAKNIYLRINGNLIDQHSSEWMDIYGQLTVKPGCKDNYFAMIQKFSDSEYTTTSFTGGRVFIPLQLWFCRNITSKNSSLIFPLCSLYNSTIELTADIRPFNNLIVSEDGVLTPSTVSIANGFNRLSITDSSLLIDYIIFEEEERNRFLQIPKQLNIINQVQSYSFNIPAGIDETTFSLKSMHYLVTEIIFIVKLSEADTVNDYFNYSNSLLSGNKNNPIESVKLIFDGRERIKKTPASNFTQIEISKVHTNTPVNKYIHCYSFALEPEKIEQPNGCCNFSELQEPLLHLTFNKPVSASTLYVYAVNYNILYCINGAGTLLHMLSKAIPTVIPDLTCTPPFGPDAKGLKP